MCHDRLLSVADAVAATVLGAQLLAWLDEQTVLRFDERSLAALIAGGQRLQARVAAGYADLRWLAQGLAQPTQLSIWLDAAAVSECCALAVVATACATLLHRVELDGDRAKSYPIVAPTDWNLHPRGAFAREITGCSAPTRAGAVTAAGRLALSLDPCVPYELTVNDA